MAKPRTPKKNTEVSPAISPATSAPIANPNVPTVEAASPLLASPQTAKAETKKATRKPEIVRTDSRATLVPINLDEEIRRLAYLYSERRGFQPGHETEDWLTAEHEVLQRYHQHSA